MKNYFSLSIIIPAYNEEEAIEKSLLKNHSVLSGFKLDYEVIVVDDGSTDKTKEIAEKVVAKIPKFKLYSKIHEGIGGTIRKGIEQACKDYVIFVVVDSPLTHKILENFINNVHKADILTGYRIERKGYSWRMRLNSNIFHFLISFLFNMSLIDYVWIHMYPRKMFENDVKIEYKGIFMLAEVLIKANAKGYTFYEFPVEMGERKTGKATAASYKAAFITLFDLIDFFIKLKILNQYK